VMISERAYPPPQSSTMQAPAAIIDHAHVHQQLIDSSGLSDTHAYSAPKTTAANIAPAPLMPLMSDRAPPPMTLDMPAATNQVQVPLSTGRILVTDQTHVAGNPATGPPCTLPNMTALLTYHSVPAVFDHTLAMVNGPQSLVTTYDRSLGYSFVYHAACCARCYERCVHSAFVGY